MSLQSHAAECMKFLAMNGNIALKASKQCDVCIVLLWKCQQSIAQVKVHLYTREFDVISATGEPYWPRLARDKSV